MIICLQNSRKKHILLKFPEMHDLVRLRKRNNRRVFTNMNSILIRLLHQFETSNIAYDLTQNLYTQPS